MAIRFVRSVQDTAWLSFHGILPTADRLVRFKMNVDPACFCGQPETLIHLFVSCPLAQGVLQWFSAQLHLYRIQIWPCQMASFSLGSRLQLGYRSRFPRCWVRYGITCDWHETVIGSRTLLRERVIFSTRPNPPFGSCCGCSDVIIRPISLLRSASLAVVL